MKKYALLLIVGILLFFSGVGVMMYPHIASRFNDKRMNEVVTGFDDSIKQMYDGTDTDEIKREIDAVNKADPNRNYTVADYVADRGITAKDTAPKLNWALISLLREQMEDYNKDLVEQGQYELNDPFSYEQASFALDTYSIADNVFGHLTAPAINMDLPIYLGANLQNMDLGAAHLSYSSMPIGGESTNAVFAGHRGIIGKIFFDNIVFLNEGDDVFVTNPWEKLHYKVIETEVISPYDIEKCYIRKGQDIITLITCHPYGYTDFRYIVVCERSEDDQPPAESSE